MKKKKAASSNEEEKEFMNWLVWMITVDAHKTHTHTHMAAHPQGGRQRRRKRLLLRARRPVDLNKWACYAR